MPPSRGRVGGGGGDVTAGAGLASKKSRSAAQPYRQSHQHHAPARPAGAAAVVNPAACFPSPSGGKSRGAGGEVALSKRVKIDHCTVNGCAVRVGDVVALTPSEGARLPYVGKLEQIEQDAAGRKWLKTRWYYRPEESKLGRQGHHGERELFLSDHRDWVPAESIIRKVTVLTLKQYLDLGVIRDEHFYCRFEYTASTGQVKPEAVTVYCKCELPYNPDMLMVQCDTCFEWFHPACIGLSAEDVQQDGAFFCDACEVSAPGLYEQGLELPFDGAQPDVWNLDASVTWKDVAKPVR
eukprot:jgi/Chlat1/6346/Chrsp44S05908